MAQPYDINMPNLLNYYNVGVDRARTNLKYAQEQEALRQEAEKNAFVAAAYRRNYDPATGSVNTNALMGELAREGYGKDIPAYMQTYQDLEKGRIANFAEELKNQKGLLAGVSDQASWDAWSANARTRLGPEIGKFIPAQFSEEAKRKLMMDADKQYEQIYREVDLKGTKEIVGSSVYGPPDATVVYSGQVTMDPNEAARIRSGAGGAGLKPRYGTVVDPADPLRTLSVDLNVYEPGFTLGDPGVRGIATTATLPAKDRAEREATFEKNRGSMESFTSKTDNLIRSLERLRSHPGLDRVVGPIQARTPTLNKQAGSAEALLKNILAQGQFRELQDMRVNSPAGSGLGNVSNFEVKALQDAFAALDPIQDEQSFRDAIDLVIQQLRDSSDIMRRTFDATYSYRNEQGAAGAASNVDDLLEKYK